jgi:predicted esterase
VLLEDGRRDEVVPQAALLNIVKAAPKGTKVRWYDAPHALNQQAYRDAFDWLATKLPIDGPRVPGA